MALRKFPFATIMCDLYRESSWSVRYKMVATKSSVQRELEFATFFATGDAPCGSRTSAKKNVFQNRDREASKNCAQPIFQSASYNSVAIISPCEPVKALVAIGRWCSGYSTALRTPPHTDDCATRSRRRPWTGCGISFVELSYGRLGSPIPQPGNWVKMSRLQSI